MLDFVEEVKEPAFVLGSDPQTMSLMVQKNEESRLLEEASRLEREL